MNKDSLLRTLRRTPLPLHNEKEAQSSLEYVLKLHNYTFNREFRLNEKDIPDFFVEGIVIELKIKGNRKAIYEQCQRYLKHEQVKGLILITSVPIGNFDKLIPKEKFLHIINLSAAWL